MTHAQQQPLAWRYQLAHARIWNNGVPGEYTDWQWHLSETEPNVPEGSLRYLTPLYAAPPRS